MFLPIGDYPNPPTTPWVTRILIGINVAIFVAVTLPQQDRTLTAEERRDPEVRAALDEMWPTWRAAYREEIEKGRRNSIPTREEWEAGLPRYSYYVHVHGYKPGKPEFWDLLYSMFLHGGLMHILGNMLFLWIYGDNVEDRLGRAAFLAGYLLTGAVATLSHAMTDPESMIPLVGASGAISGVLGFYLVWFHRNRIKVFVWLFYMVDVWHIRAVWVLLMYVVLDNLLPLLSESESAVAYGAHLGGFVAGVLIALGIDRIFGRRPVPVPDVAPAGAGGWRRRGRLAEMAMERDLSAVFRDAIRGGRPDEAAHAFARLAREGGSPPASGDVWSLARWLYENDYVRDSLAVFHYYLKNYPKGEDLDRVHLGLGILLSRRMGETSEARRHLMRAIELAGPGSPIHDTARAELALLDGGA